MTVKKLIQKLSEMPPDSKVYIAIDDLNDRENLVQVVGIVIDGVTDVLICETDLGWTK